MTVLNEQLRGQIVTLRLTGLEHQVLKSAARKHGHSLNLLARGLLMQEPNEHTLERLAVERDRMRHNNRRAVSVCQSN